MRKLVVQDICLWANGAKKTLTGDALRTREISAIPEPMLQLRGTAGITCEQVDDQCQSDLMKDAKCVGAVKKQIEIWLRGGESPAGEWGNAYLQETLPDSTGVSDPENHKALLNAGREQEYAARHQAELTRRLSDKKLMGPVLSASLCLFQAFRASSLNEVAEEKRYSKIGGVQNNLKLYQLQSRIRIADKNAAKAHEMIKKMGIKPMTCSRPEMKQAVVCIAKSLESSPSQTGCDSPDVQGFLELVAATFDDLAPAATEEEG